MWTEEKMAFKCKGVDWHVKPAHCCPVSFRKCRINESSLSFFQLAVAFSRDGMCFPPFQCAFQLKAISFRKTYYNRFTLTVPFSTLVLSLFSFVFLAVITMHVCQIMMAICHMASLPTAPFYCKVY